MRIIHQYTFNGRYYALVERRLGDSIEMKNMTALSDAEWFARVEALPADPVFVTDQVGDLTLDEFAAAYPKLYAAINAANNSTVSAGLREDN